MSFPETLIVQVTATDIRLGKKADCDKCPVARALARTLRRRRLPGKPDVSAREVAVFRRYARFTGGGALMRWRHNAAGFIDRFDKGKPVEPREVRLTVPPYGYSD